MKSVSHIIQLILLIVMLLGLPLFGCLLSGMPCGQYLEFPPRTRYVEHAPFSWWAFMVLSGFLVLILSKFIFRVFTNSDVKVIPRKRIDRPFPWWGWVGIFLTGTSWLIAWNRFTWVGAFQGHTFTPIWVGYIITVNALLYWRTGQSPLTHNTDGYLALFPASAAFWWFFEYLNRFVQNWFYLVDQYDSWAYFWYATLPFSTVLPAVVGTYMLIKSFSWPEHKFGDFIVIKVKRPRILSVSALIISAVGLSAIGIFPNLLFPLLWISPLLIIVSLKGVLSEQQIFSPVSYGNWVNIVSAGTAALICGFFWEMWNSNSLNKWVYEIPYVHKFTIFEMPLLGYAGYIPFGVECVVVSDFVLRLLGLDQDRGKNPLN